ncbi:MAG: ion channel, partial [Flavobacteriaceae bacterium]|nr:ion channel [Flavobacteriaceae bacterium]
MTKDIFSKINLVISLTKELIFLIALLLVFFVGMNLWGHQENSHLWAGALVIFSITKIYFLVSHTFKKLNTLIENNHSFNHMLLLLGAIITIIITSFAIDYLCVSEIYTNAFSGIENGQPSKYRFFDLLYFSIVTFTTVGYGDI